VFIDPDLLQYPEVWAAAGTWHDVFGLEPHQLVAASNGLVTDRDDRVQQHRARRPSPCWSHINRIDWLMFDPLAICRIPDEEGVE